MARGPRKAAEKKAEAEEQEAPTAAEVYAGYTPPAVADQVEVRINNKIVYLDSLYGAKLETLAAGIKVNGTPEPPKTPKQAPEEHVYNPTTDETGGAQVTPVPATDPEYTEALDESATPDDDDEK